MELRQALTYIPDDLSEKIATISGTLLSLIDDPDQRRVIAKLDSLMETPTRSNEVLESLRSARPLLRYLHDRTDDAMGSMLDATRRRRDIVDGVKGEWWRKQETLNWTPGYHPDGWYDWVKASKLSGA